MLIDNTPQLHLTYCLNVHRGATWQDNLDAIKNYTLKIRSLVCPNRRLGLGLRISDAASRCLINPKTLDAFRRFLDDNDLYVFTINGFPFGNFHDTPVKRDVYKPSWRDPSRKHYTIRLARILASLLDDGIEGTISTLPGAYATEITSGDDIRAMAKMMTEVANELANIEIATGKIVHLAIEPEPNCYIETTRQFIDFFDGPMTDCCDGDILRRYVGMCLDTAHEAVVFDDPLTSLKSLSYRIKKVQLSSAISVTPTYQAIKQLEPFCEDIYLHQVKAKTSDGKIISYDDLPDAIGAWVANRDAQWRIHYHVPLFFSGSGALHPTTNLLTPELIKHLSSIDWPGHLEIETYTFNILPSNLKPVSIVEGIAQEFSWVKSNLM